MTRTRLTTPPAPQLKTLEDVDAALLQLADVQRTLDAIAANADEEIARVREEAKELAAAPSQEKARLERALQEYAESRRADFADVRTRELAHGRIGFRLSSKVAIKKIGDTLAALKRLNLVSCIRTKEEPDKEAMRNLDAKTLASVGATLKTEDCFWYELKREDVEVAQ